jgi:hypothetical protein
MYEVYKVYKEAVVTRKLLQAALSDVSGGHDKLPAGTELPASQGDDTQVGQSGTNL